MTIDVSSIEELDPETATVQDVLMLQANILYRMQRLEIAVADTVCIVMVTACHRDTPEEIVTAAVERMANYVEELGREAKRAEAVQIHIDFLNQPE